MSQSLKNYNTQAVNYTFYTFLQERVDNKVKDISM